VLNKSLIMLDKAVDIWHEFLDSLATVGGNIFILLVLWCVGLFGVIHVLHHPEANEEARSLVLSSFSGISGALMFALTQRQKSGNGNGDFKKMTPAAEPKNPNEVKSDGK
jgi:hypothetical protein